MIWTTREGTRIAVQDMTDLHLTHTIQFAKRKVRVAEEERDATFAVSVSGEMATYYASGAQNDAIAKVGGWMLVLSALEEEQKRRRTP